MSWESMTERERDAWVGVALFEWRWLLHYGSGGHPYACAVYPPEAPGRIIFNEPVNAIDVTSEFSFEDSERFSDWDRIQYRDGDGTSRPECLPHYTTDASADYEVLKHVRGGDSSISFDEFSGEFFAMHAIRRRTGEVPLGGIAYRPGDYSKAAYLAKTAEQEPTE